MARHKLYEIERARYEAKRAACKACPQREIEHAALLAEMGIKLDIWELTIYDRPAVVAALEQASREIRRARRQAKAAAQEAI